MSFRVVRQSKYRHVFGEPYKKEMCFEGVRITRNAWDSPFVTVNPKFCAVALEAGGGGAFMVLNNDQPGRVDLNAPKICGHKGAVLCIQFNPFNDHVIASSSEDCNVMVWEIPEGGVTEDITDPAITLSHHQRRVGIVEWHPTADNVLISAGFDYQIVVWQVNTGEAKVVIDCHTDTIYSMSWNWDGSLFATTSKDKKIRVIDPRSGKPIQTGDGHKGTKGSRVAFLGDTGMLFTTGFSKMSERQYALWSADDLSQPLKLEMLDTSSGVLFPYYDHDTKVVFVGGKGDGNIRYYEITDEKPYVYHLSDYRSSKPQRGLALMPKRGMNIADCEIARFYKLHPTGTVEPIKFKVPRKSTLFQEDIFPETKKDAPVLTADQWFAGENKNPETVSLKDGYVAPVSNKLVISEQAAKAKKEEEAQPKGEKELEKAYHELQRELKTLKEKLATADINLRKVTAERDDLQREVDILKQSEA